MQTLSSRPTSVPQGLVILAILAVQVIFGIHYIVAKSLVTLFPPLVWGSTRLVISAILMAMLSFALKRPHPPRRFKYFGPVILFSALGIFINQACFLVGLKYTSSTNSAILNTTAPMMAMFLSVLIGFEKLSFLRVIGFIVSFLSILVLRHIEDFRFSDQSFHGDLLILVNCLSFACFLSFSKNFMKSFDTFWTTTYLFAFGSLGMCLIAFPEWIHFHVPPLNGIIVLEIVFSIVGATLVTYFLNNWALRNGASSNVALYIYLQPVVTLAFAALWTHHRITIRETVSCLLLFVGMCLATQRNVDV